MGRVKLTTMLDDVKHSLEPGSTAEAEPNTPVAFTGPRPVPDVPPTKPAPQERDAAQLEADGPTPSAPRATPRRSPTRREEASLDSHHVHYASLVRKEARLRDDQIESLMLRARKLSRNKVGTDERITDNTLIRIAVDMLLAREADLAGNSEAELRKSVGL